MRSRVELYNLALAMLGGNQLDTIRAPEENSLAASLCESLFPSILDAALAAHPWSFALKRAELARVEGGGFQLPDDCLRPARILDGTYSGADYTIEGRTIVTEGPSARLLYVARVSDPGLWPPGFALALAWGLASALSTALVNDVRRQQLCLQQHLAALQSAVSQDLSRQSPAKPVGEWIGSRHG